MAVTTKKDPSTSSALVEVMRRTLASALDPNTWEIHGDEAVIVHHLGFRKALTEYFGTTFLDPRLQWYYDGGVSLHLRMYSGPASMFTKTTIVRLAQSLRAALTENAALWGIAVIANPRGGNGAG